MKLGVLISTLAICLCALTASTIAADVTISEFLSVNDSGITDRYGHHSDWLELHNTTAADISLAGWYLTDDASELTKWQIPDVTLAAGAYMVIFASDENDTAPANELHTNFKLSSSGEYIALVRPDGVTVEFSYPAVSMSSDVSYGLDAGGSAVYFNPPTPGAGPAGGTVVVSPVAFSVAHGFFNSPIALELSCETLGATIRYTTDGSDPASGSVYTSPLYISDTTVVRASASRAGLVRSESVTQSYIFLSSVVAQSNNQWSRGFPAVWHAGAGGSGIYDSEYRTADYAMDTDITGDPIYGNEMENALLSIPTISMVMDLDDLFDSQTGIYPNSIQRASVDPMWEKPASLELIDPAGKDDFTVNCGSRIMGEVARWAAVNDKQSFRVVFQEEYGPTKLKTNFFGTDDGVDKYDTLVMRANWGDGFMQDALLGDRLNTSWLEGTPWTSQYIRDIYGHDTYKATGQIGVDGRFAHLYINGLYWGVYEVIERPDNNFHGQHFSGSDDEFDVFKGAIWNANNGENGVLQDGETATWYKLFSYFDCNPWTGDNYDDEFTDIDNAALAEIEQYLDIDAFIDFMISLWVIDRGDFPKKNWYAVCRRNPDGGAPLMPFKFYTWDNEASLWNVEGHFAFERWNYVGVFPADKNDTGPVRIYKRLRTNPDFCMRWAQRVSELLCDDGPLGPQANADRYQARVDEVKLALYAESARWGDTAESQLDDPIKIEDQWQTEYLRLMNEYFPVRNDYVYAQMQEVGMYPTVGEPIIENEEGLFDGVTDLSISLQGTDGVIYYTLDGSDPRLPGGDVNPYALEKVVAPTATDPQSIWTYNADGIDLGTDWCTADFDDSGWNTGRGQFGYGDGDEDEIVHPALVGDGLAMTTYFRHVLYAEGITDESALNLSMIVDDGAVVYVNNQEVLRVNMPGGEIAFDTPAASSVDGAAQRTFQNYQIGAGYLVDGLNVIAVEIHQDSPFAADMSFEMQADFDGSGAGLNSFPLEYDAHVFARAYVDGQWSIYTEKILNVNTPSEIEISEVHYHPADPNSVELAAGFDADDFEFIELHNVSSYQTVESAAVFTDGIDYVIPTFTLAPGEYAVLVSNDEAFRMRFGDEARIIGDYGDRLSNGGENLRLEDSYGVVIAEFAYDDSGLWPVAADGYGYSLNLIADKSIDDDASSWTFAAPSPGEGGSGYSGVQGDLDFDSDIDGDDVQLLIEAIDAASDLLVYDLDGSFAVDQADLDYMFSDILNISPCDINMDGNVDISDFLILRSNYNTNARWDQGDVNTNGFVDMYDFLLLRAAYGYISPVVQ